MVDKKESHMPDKGFRTASCKGAVSVEYGFILFLIFLAIIAAVSSLGNGVANLYVNAVKMIFP